MRLGPAVLWRSFCLAFVATGALVFSNVGIAADPPTLESLDSQLKELSLKLDVLPKLVDDVEKLKIQQARAATQAVNASAGRPRATSAGTIAPARKVHFLFFSLVNDPYNKIGPGAAANHAFLMSLAGKIQSFNSSDRVNIAASEQQFTEAIFNARVDAIASDITDQDTVFCYISTHGGFDRTRGHLLFTSNGNGEAVARSAVFKKLNDRNPRQLVLVTDSCANVSGVAAAPAAVPAALPPYALYFLLFNFAGVQNINGCSVGELSWYGPTADNRGGGVFTRAFMRAAVEGASADWAAFFVDLRARTLAAGGDFTGTQPQTPAQFDAAGQQVQ